MKRNSNLKQLPEWDETTTEKQLQPNQQLSFTCNSISYDWENF